MHFIAFAAPEIGLGHHILFGSGGESSVHPVVLVAMILVIILILALPRKHVLGPLIFLSIFNPGGIVMVGPFHFQVGRILLIFAWMRLLWQRFGREGRRSRIAINSVDKAVICYTVTLHSLIARSCGRTVRHSSIRSAKHTMSSVFILFSGSSSEIRKTSSGR